MQWRPGPKDALQQWIRYLLFSLLVHISLLSRPFKRSHAMNGIRIRTRPLLTPLSKTSPYFQVQQLKTTGTTATKRAKVTNTNNTTSAKQDPSTKVSKTKSGAADLKPTKVSTEKSKTTTTHQPASATGLRDIDGTRIRVWLMKSEPDTFSIDDLINSKDSTSHWDGVVSTVARIQSLVRDIYSMTEVTRY